MNENETKALMRFIENVASEHNCAETEIYKEVFKTIAIAIFAFYGEEEIDRLIRIARKGARK